jgi:GntR family transcriptional repressor for pyruvate dehydrogenase complex
VAITRGPEAVARRLERAIQRGEFASGTRMPSERALAARWSMSRPIVREGIAMLVAKGVLSRRHGSGTYVNDAEAHMSVEVWRDLALRHDNLQADLIEFRHMLERRAAELAAVRHDASDRRRLEAAGAAVDAAWESTDRQQQLLSDAAFHHAIADATHNPVFAYLMRSLHQILLEHMRLTHAGSRLQSAITRDVQQQHRRLLQAILAGEPEAAADAASDHLDYVQVRLNHLPPRRGMTGRRETMTVAGATPRSGQKAMEKEKS